MNIKIIVNHSDRKSKTACYKYLIDKYKKTRKDLMLAREHVNDSAKK